MIGWSTQPFTNLPLLDGPGPHWAHSEYVAQHKKPDGIGTLPTYVSRKPHWNLVGLLGGHIKRLKKWSIKKKNTKNKFVPYSTPNVSNIHIIPKSWLLWSLHTNNVWEDRTLGPPKTALCQCRLCSVVSPKTTQTHICITNNLPTIYFTLLYFTTSLTIYFTLLHSLKTRLFINPVLNNPHGPATNLTLMAISALQELSAHCLLHFSRRPTNKP